MKLCYLNDHHSWYGLDQWVRALHISASSHWLSHWSLHLAPKGEIRYGRRSGLAIFCLCHYLGVVHTKMHGSSKLDRMIGNIWNLNYRFRRKIQISYLSINKLRTEGACSEQILQAIWQLRNKLLPREFWRDLIIKWGATPTHGTTFTNMV